MIPFQGLSHPDPGSLRLPGLFILGQALKQSWDYSALTLGSGGMIPFQGLSHPDPGSLWLLGLFVLSKPSSKLGLA
jgi:hypothetical protein